MSTTEDPAERKRYMTAGARAATQKLAWSVIVLFVFTIAIGLVNLLFTTSQDHGLQAANARLEIQVRADCTWYADLAGLPLPVNPGTKKPTRLAVQLVADSRRAWTARGCPGRLAPPDPSLPLWAKYYGIPLG